jgi:hypothetical protein
MTGPNKITGITNTLAKATLGDGAVPTSITLPNNIRPKAAITSLTTMFEVVWYKPHRYIWLQYTTKEKAEAACEALQGKEIAGMRFRCDFKKALRSELLQYSVRLQGIPPNVELADITPYLPQREEPDGTGFSNLSYQANLNALEHICNKISARTSEQIKYRRSIEVNDGRKQKAEITLQAEAANLAAHAKALDGIILPELGNSKVFFVERLRLYVAIESDIYKRRSKTMKGIADRAWKTHHIEMEIFDGELRHAQNTFLILITGNGRDAVKKVKAEIDGCIAADAIKGLQREAGLPVTKCNIYLNTVRELRQAVNGGGLDRLRKYYGDGAVSFKEEADVPSITVTSLGGKVDKAKEVLFREYAKGTDVGESPICAEENVKLLKGPDCEHSSCETCLDDYCTTNISAALPLRCFSDRECSNIYPIRWLEQTLSPVAYRALFEGVIAAQCQQDPNHFVRCAGPDCDQHLATTKRTNKTTCPVCLNVNCTTCKTQFHFGETCEESQSRRDPHEVALGQYLAGVGGKLCPRCDTPGIRINGCFHIECPVCKAHYCWLCLVAFPGMGDAYAHMDRTHGGPYGGPGDAQERDRHAGEEPVGGRDDD